MAKDNITDYSQTADSNTDIGGVGLADNDRANNVRRALQQMAAALARVNAAVAPLDDTFSVRNATDTSKTANIDASHIPTSTSRALDAEALYRNGAYRTTYYTTPGVTLHIYDAESRFYQLIGVGGGGGGGGCDGQAASSGAGTGGSSGFYGWTDILAIPVDGSGEHVKPSMSIGTAGAGGVASNNGTAGGNTTWNDGTNAFTWGGGPGGRGQTADANGTLDNYTPAASSSGALFGFAARGDANSCNNASPPKVRSGRGADNPLGTGGFPHVPSSGGASDGEAAFGYGSGGSGGASYNTAANATGGAGASGIIIVREW